MINELEATFTRACGTLKSAEARARRSRTKANVEAYLAAEAAYNEALTAITEARDAAERAAAQADAIAQIEVVEAEEARYEAENPKLF